MDLQKKTAVSGPHEFDVIKGRGNGANLHPGNVSFRKLVTAHKDAYYVSSNDEKKRIVLRIIQLVQASTPSGRFLTEHLGIWKLMDDKSVFRKVGQALREQQNNKPPSVINIEPPAGQEGESLNDNSKRRIDEVNPVMNNNSNQTIVDFTCDIRNAHKLPKIGEKDTHKAQTQQYQIGVVKEDISLLREHVAILSKRVTFLEKQHIEKKKQRTINCNLSHSVTKDLGSKVSYNSVGQPEITQHTPNSKDSLILGCVSPHPSGNSPNPTGNSSPGSTQHGTKSFIVKPSLHDFSKNLETSLKDITHLDNPEDFLFSLLTNKPDQPGRHQIQ